MRLEQITNYLLRHRNMALMLTFVSTFVPIIGIVGILYAALVTLRKGIAEGAIFTLAATLPYAASIYFTSNQETAIPLVFWAAVGVAVLSNVLTWVFAVMLRRQATWSQILQVAALLGVLVISVIHLAYPEIADWWGDQLQSYYQQATKLTDMMKDQANVTGDMQLETINITKQYATGIMTGAILFNAILQLIVARWWQAVIYSPGLLRRELQSIRLTPLAGLLFVTSLVLSYMGNSVVLDIMPVLYMLFGAAGLSLIHNMFGMMKSGTRWFWLWLMYITLIFALPTSMLLISLVALFDIWLDMRKRLRKV